MNPDELPWPLPDRTDLRDRLVAAYSSTGRGYHDVRHLAEVLARIDDLGEAENVEVVLAGWFHDAVHEVTGDNEERSAVLAETELRELDGSEVAVAEVTRLVRLTERHDPAADDHHGAVLCDADLAILAAPPERYRQYAAGVRKEYAAFSAARFRVGRLAVLEDLARREPLFHTAHGRDVWEPRARANLAVEIAALSAQG